MTDPELFETGEGVIAEGHHPPFNALGVAIILELHALASGKVGEDTLRGAMRFFLASTFTNEEGLTGEIGRVIGKGTPIPPRILNEVKRLQPTVIDQLEATLRRMLETLTDRRKSL